MAQLNVEPGKNQTFATAPVLATTGGPSFQLGTQSNPGTGMVAASPSQILTTVAYSQCEGASVPSQQSTSSNPGPHPLRS
jgi:hypothetical protein